MQMKKKKHVFRWPGQAIPAKSQFFAVFSLFLLSPSLQKLVKIFHLHR